MPQADFLTVTCDSLRAMKKKKKQTQQQQPGAGMLSPLLCG